MNASSVVSSAAAQIAAFQPLKANATQYWLRMNGSTGKPSCVFAGVQAGQSIATEL